MTGPISTRKHGDVLIVLSNNPPVNALGAAVRQGLVAAIAEAEADGKDLYSGRRDEADSAHGRHREEFVALLLGKGS